MSDLSRSLIDAAAEVLPAAYAEACGVSGNLHDVVGSPEEWRIEARAAAAAVLEPLADYANRPGGWSLSEPFMRTLVAEVKEETKGGL